MNMLLFLIIIEGVFGKMPIINPSYKIILIFRLKEKTIKQFKNQIWI